MTSISVVGAVESKLNERTFGGLVKEKSVCWDSTDILQFGVTQRRVLYVGSFTCESGCGILDHLFFLALYMVPQ